MPKLNPWYIEIDYYDDNAIRLNVISSNTGEIIQIKLTVNDIHSISIIGNERLTLIADILDNKARLSQDLDALICYKENNEEDDDK